jgi:hypothetical protein
MSENWWGVYYTRDGEPSSLVAAFQLEDDARDWVDANPGFPKAVFPIEAVE